MNEEQIKAILEDFKTSLLSEVDSKNAGLAASITKKTQKLIEPKQESEETLENRLTLQSLQDEIKNLRAEAEAKDKAFLDAQKKEAIYSTVNSTKTVGKSILTRQLQSIYSDSLVKENDTWYVQEGETVKEFKTVVDDYLASEEGALFVAPNNSKGTGSITTNNKVVAPTVPTEEEKYGL